MRGSEISKNPTIGINSGRASSNSKVEQTNPGWRQIPRRSAHSAAGMAGWNRLATEERSTPSSLEYGAVIRAGDFSRRLGCLCKFEPFPGNAHPCGFVERVSHLLSYVRGFIGSLTATGGLFITQLTALEAFMRIVAQFDGIVGAIGPMTVQFSEASERLRYRQASHKTEVNLVAIEFTINLAA